MHIHSEDTNLHYFCIPRLFRPFPLVITHILLEHKLENNLKYKLVYCM